MKKILKKIFLGKSPISNWLLIFVMYVALVMFATILDLTRTIEQEQWLRICPEPYICVVPDPESKARPPMGFTIYKTIEV